MLEKARLVQTLSKCGHEFLAVFKRSAAQETPITGIAGLLRTRRKRPRSRRAAEQRDEFAALQSFNHLVGALLDMQRYVESERFRGLEIDDQFNPGRKFDRQISRLCTLQDFVNIDCSVPKVLALINAVACEPPDLDTVAPEKIVGSRAPRAS